MVHPKNFQIPPKEIDPKACTITWLGTAGFVLEHKGKTLLLDPYLSRVSLSRFLFTKIAPCSTLVDQYLNKADYIVAGHSHFDHALDVPYLAQKTGALVFGSRSTANLLRQSGVPGHQIREMYGGETVEAEPFLLTFHASVHSPFFFGRVPFGGDISEQAKLPMHGSKYRCGLVFGITIEVDQTKIYHQGSCGLVDGNMPDSEIDIFLACIAGRQGTPDFVTRALKKVGPRILVPCHYDNFFMPIDQPLKILPSIHFERFVEEARSAQTDIQIATFDLLQKTALPL